MRDSHTSIVLICIAAVGLTGCGAGASLSTGSLFGSASPKSQPVAAAPRPASPTDRALFSAATAAKAQHCGYHFDPVQLKANFIAAETQAGLQPAEVEKLAKSYDITQRQFAASLAREEDFCNEAENTRIKTALNRQLAGDFSPPPKKVVAEASLLDSLSSTKRNEEFDGQKLFDRIDGVIEARDAL